MSDSFAAKLLALSKLLASAPARTPDRPAPPRAQGGENLQKKPFRFLSSRSLRGVVRTNLAKQMPRRPLAKAREARLVDEGGVVAFFRLNQLARRHATNA